MDRAQDWDRAYDAAELRLPVDPHPELERVLGPLIPGRGLELGCGEGRPSIWLAGRGWEMTAVDFSAVAVERGRHIAEAHGAIVDWRVVDVVDYEPAAGLDLALLVYLHVAQETLCAVIGRAAAGLAPGGSLVVLGWDRSNAAAGAGGPRPVERLYDLDELVAAAAGLRVERAERVPQPGSDAARDAILHAVVHREVQKPLVAMRGPVSPCRTRTSSNPGQPSPRPRRPRRAAIHPDDGRCGGEQEQRCELVPIRPSRNGVGPLPSLAMSIVPVIRYADADAAITFLTSAFGLIAGQVNRNDDGSVGHAELSSGDAVIMLGTRSDPPGPFDGGPAVVYVVVDDPDAHHDKATAAGAEVIDELVDQPYGSREYAARDPEGNVWSFGTYRPQAAPVTAMDLVLQG